MRNKPLPEISGAVLARFMGKLTPGKPGECWPWEHGCRGEYGAFNISPTELIGVHRLAYLVFKGPFDFRLMILHSCDNPPCWNPEHLSPGTGKNNTQDALSKGRIKRGAESWSATHKERLARGAKNGKHTHPEKILRGDDHPWRKNPELVPRGDRNGLRKHPESVQRGELNACAKLTELQVKEMRELSKAGWVLRELSARFGVSMAMISMIVRRKKWTHVL